MYEPPAHLAQEQLIEALREDYRLNVADLRFLPLGHDASAWVYRAQTVDGANYFLKVRTAVHNPVSLIVPRYLHDQGIKTVAPIATQYGRLWVEVAQYVLIVYPFIAGASGMQQRLTAQQWRAYGAILRSIHDLPVPAELARQLRRESFQPDGAASVRLLDGHIDNQVLADELAQHLAAFWRTHRVQIHNLLTQAEALGRHLADTSPALVLCHADIHTNNLLIEPTGQLWVVDWDETLLAPRERDLMFAVGGISERLVSRQEEAWFLEGYGTTVIDPLALAYYRYAWAIGDIGSFAAQVVLRPDLSLASRAAALEACSGLFAPGEIVAIAERMRRDDAPRPPQ